MAKTREVLISLEQAPGEEIVANDGVSFDNADDAQHALDAAIYKIHTLQEEHKEACSELDQAYTHLYYASALRTAFSDPAQNATLSEEAYRNCVAIYNGLFEGAPALPSLESFHHEPVKTTSIATEELSTNLGRVARSAAESVGRFKHSVEEFFKGHEDVCNRAIGVLAEADRILDKGVKEPKVRKVSIAGAIYVSLQAGERDYSFQQAVDLTDRNSKEYIDHFMPECVAYAHGMARAFEEADLTKVRHRLGIDKAGFMKLAAPFAAVRPPELSFCKHHGEKRWLFGLLRDDYKEVLYSDVFPGNTVVELVHPVGDLEKLLDREDAKGFYKNFGSWLSVDVGVRKIKAKRPKEGIVTDVPTPEKIRSDINRLRVLIKTIRTFSTKSDEYEHVVEETMDAFEKHVVNSLNTPGGLAAHAALGSLVAVGDVANVAGMVMSASTLNPVPAMVGRGVDTVIDFTIVPLFVGFAHLASTAGRVLTGAIVNIGGYYATELRDLSSLTLRMAKQYS
ncbi:MAG TPA: hypothetical protein VN081_04335 [Dongiaceae bacterium]|nr:hypothetical protein [Dongiaceae bacterium]